MSHEMSILQMAIAKWGKDAQMKMVLEEMSELQKEICKMWRGKENRDAIAEEVADVEIMLDQLKIMLNVTDDVERHRTEKLCRLEKRLLERDAVVEANLPDPGIGLYGSITSLLKSRGSKEGTPYG